MAIFGRSFPFPRRYVNHLVGNVAPASTVRPQYVRARLPDRPRPKLGAFVSKAPSSTNTALTAAQGSYILTGIDAQFIRSQFASSLFVPVGLPDRPRPFPHVTIKGMVGPASTIEATIVRPVRLADRPRPKPSVFIGKALPTVSSPTLTAGRYIQPVGLLRIRHPRPDVVIGTVLTTVSNNVTLTAAQGSYILTGIDAQFIFSRFASQPVPVRLSDRSRPFPHVLINKPLSPIVAGSVVASTGSYVLTGQDAAFIRSSFASPLFVPVGLPDRPRPFPHVTIKTRIPAVSTTTLLASTGTYILTGEDAQFTTKPEWIIRARRRARR